VGETNTQLFSSHWPGDDKSILDSIASIVDTTILSIVNAAIGSLPNLCWKIRVLWGCWEEPNGDAGLHACNITTIFDNNTAARLVKAEITLDNPIHFCIVYRGQQAYCTSGTQMPMHGGRSYLPPPADEMINIIREEADDDAESKRPNRRSFPTTKTCFQKFERKLQSGIIR